MKNEPDLCLVSRRWQIATFVVIILALFFQSLNLLEAWQYKSKWQKLNDRVEKLEAKR